MKNSRILLVEDNPDHQELTLMTLAENNVLNEIVVASDGVEALARPYSGPACRLIMLYHGLAPKGLTSELNQAAQFEAAPGAGAVRTGPAGHGAGCAGGPA